MIDIAFLLRKLCNYSGIPLREEFFKTRIAVLVFTSLVTVVLTVDMVIKLIVEKELSVEKKVLCVQDMLIVVSIYAARLDFMMNVEHEAAIINFIEKKELYFVGNNPEIDRLLERESDDLQKIGGFVLGLMCVMGVSAFIFPAIVALFVILGSNGEVPVKSLPVLFSCWYPEGTHTLLFYFLILINQSCFLYTCLTFGGNAILMSFCSMHVIANDLRLLCVLTEQLNQVLHSTRGKRASHIEECDLEVNLFHSDQIESTETPFLLKNEDEDTDTLLRNIIITHQNVHRKVNTLSKGLGHVTPMMCNTFCFQICVCLFCTLQVDEIMVKSQYFILLAPVVYVMYAVGKYGQNVIDEGENFKTALWNSSWIDMTRMEKKNILIVMTQASRQMEIRGFGVLIINLKMFSNIMNAAYSYYSLLNAI